MGSGASTARTAAPTTRGAKPHKPSSGKAQRTVSIDLNQHALNALATSLKEDAEDQQQSGADFKSTDVRLQGGIATLGEYYVNAFIDGQKMRLQVDTGSASVIVVGEGCANCTSRSVLKWNKADSVPCDGKTCFQCYPGSEACGFRLKYGDDSPQYNLEATGVIVQTRARLRKDWIDSSDVTVYVIQREIGMWPKKVDGILGMAFPRLNCNPTCFPPAWQSLAPEGSTAFKFCIGDKGGKLSFLGRSSKNESKPRSIKLPILGNPKMYYTVASRGLGIHEPRDDSKNRFSLFTSPDAGNEIGPHSVAIMDTGTTLLIIPQSSWRLFVRYMQTRYCHLPGVCESPSLFDRPGINQAICLTESPYETFPTLGLALGDGVVKLPPSLYFIRYEQNIYCLGIQGGPALVVGDALLRGFSTIYEPDSVTITSHRDADCGEVSGLVGDDLVIETAHFDIAHQSSGGPSPAQRAISLGILLATLYFLVQTWRRYMRRRMGYAEI